MMFTKNKRKAKDATWRDYRRLIVSIGLWLAIVQLILTFDPIVLDITTSFESQAEFAIFTGLVSVWMLIAYRYGRKWGFTRKWMLICFVASVFAMLMLTIERHYRYFPPECVYERFGESFLLIRTRLDCIQIFTYPLY